MSHVARSGSGICRTRHTVRNADLKSWAESSDYGRHAEALPGPPAEIDRDHESSSLYLQLCRLCGLPHQSAYERVLFFFLQYVLGFYPAALIS